MAKSPAHKFGQMLGNILELLIEPKLEEFCAKENLYLDSRDKKRPARRGKKVSWKDDFGNSHDLDYVIEKNGTDETIGQPVAFIEVAWRRYTRHSRNKAQEIQGAILPLVEKYKWNNPFIGTILSGEFTNGALDQLHSLGFNILYFPYATMVAAFEAEGFDIRFGDKTTDEAFLNTVEILEKSGPEKIDHIKNMLLELNKEEINTFFSELKIRLSRHVVKVIIYPLYGRYNGFYSIQEAITFLNGQNIYEGSGEFQKFEIFVDFSNGDKLQGSFELRERAIEFLKFISQ